MNDPATPPRRVSLVVLNPDPPSPSSNSTTQSSPGSNDNQLIELPATPPSSACSWDERAASPSPESRIPKALQEISLEHRHLIDQNRRLLLANRRAASKAQRNRRQVRQLTARAQGAETRFQTLVNQNSELETSNANLSTALQTRTQELETTQTHLQTIQTRNLALQETNDCLTQELDILKTTLTTASLDAETAYSQIADLRRSNCQLNEQIRSFEKQRDVFQKELDRVHQERQGLREMQRNAELEAGELQLELHRLSENELEYRAAIAGLEAERDPARMRAALLGAVCALVMLGIIFLCRGATERVVGWE